MKIVERQITWNLYKKHKGPLNNCLQYEGTQSPNVAVFEILGEISLVYEYCINPYRRGLLKLSKKSVAEKND